MHYMFINEVDYVICKPMKWTTECCVNLFHFKAYAVDVCRCIQNRDFIFELCSSFSMITEIPEVSEDCLYLNIYTPAKPGDNAKLPVSHRPLFTFHIFISNIWSWLKHTCLCLINRSKLTIFCTLNSWWNLPSHCYTVQNLQLPSVFHRSWFGFMAED